MIENRNYRRLLLKMGLVPLTQALDPTMSFAGALAKSIIRDATLRAKNKKQSGAKARNYIQFNLAGAPTRWMWDHFLKPNATDRFIPHPAIFTGAHGVLDASRGFCKTEYLTELIKGYHVPILWRNEVAKAGGGFRPMADLLDNLLMIRGIDMRMEGHPVNTAHQVCPLDGGLSLTGVVADHSSKIMPALSVGRGTANRAFKSATGVCAIDIPVEHSCYAEYLFESFYNEGGRLPAEVKAETAIAKASEILEAYSLKNHPGSEILFNERSRARALVKEKINGLGESFERLIDKYEDLLHRSGHQKTFAKLNDFKLNSLSFPIELKGKWTIKEAFGHFQQNDLVVCENLDNVATKFSRRMMASQFALAEFASIEEISSSILLAAPNESWNFYDQASDLWGLVEKDLDVAYDAKKEKTTFSVREGKSITRTSAHFPMDSHSTGAYINFQNNNRFFLGFAAAMLELVDRLKETKIAGKSLFDETIIHVASEFDRQPMADLGGTDHNFHAGVTSVISGIVKGPTVLGNIFVGAEKDEKPETRFGTRGDAAPVKGLRNKITNFQNVSSTMSALLRVPPIVSRAQSLIEMSGDKIVPTIEDARNVEGIWDDNHG